MDFYEESTGFPVCLVFALNGSSLSERFAGVVQFGRMASRGWPGFTWS